MFETKLPYGHDWLMTSDAAKAKTEVLSIAPINGKDYVFCMESWLVGDKRVQRIKWYEAASCDVDIKRLIQNN